VETESLKHSGKVLDAAKRIFAVAKAADKSGSRLLR